MKLRPAIGIVALVIALVAAQLVLRAMDKEYCLTQLTMAIYYAIVVIGLCFIMGYAGQVSLGHGAFYAIGAYVAAILMDRFDVPYWATIPAAGTVTTQAVWIWLITRQPIACRCIAVAMSSVMLAVSSG